ncbi:hypothetical protein ABES02_29190 [Neobacillus pocheonensis]|uniref:hypothetical protein n=1 Tax=Neobacillus pocheonensis TaxID=363869 RepID=UPI003D29C215
MDDPLYEQHKDELMKFDLWKNIKNKDIRRDLLRHWRLKIGDYEIRQAWGLSFGTFYYHLRALGLTKTAEEKTAKAAAKQFETELLSAGGEGQDSQNKTEQQTSDNKRFIIKGNEVIEAEYEVVRESNRDNPSGNGLAVILDELEELQRKAAAVTSGVYLNFDFKGDYPLLEKKFKNIMGLLEGEGTLRVRIEIYRG